MTVDQLMAALQYLRARHGNHEICVTWEGVEQEIDWDLIYFGWKLFDDSPAIFINGDGGDGRRQQMLILSVRAAARAKAEERRRNERAATQRHMEEIEQKVVAELDPPPGDFGFPATPRTRGVD